MSKQVSKQVAKQETEKQAVNSDGAKPEQAAVITVSDDDMPVSCPMPDQTLWSQHPRVFMAFDKEGRANCPYCGNRYQLIE